MTDKRLSMCARSVGVVGRGSSADITLLLGLVQPLVLLLALVRLLMAKAGCQRFPFISPLVLVVERFCNRRIRRVPVGRRQNHKRCLG